MRRRTLVIIAACIITLTIVAISLILWGFSGSPQTYKKNVARNFDNPDEQHALSAVESADYTAITSLERFQGSNSPEAYIHPGTYLTYTYANFIDSETINYYQARYENQHGKTDPKSVTLTYTANVTQLSKVRVFNGPSGNMTRENQTITWHNNTVVFFDSSSSTTLTSANFMSMYSHVFYLNQTEYQALQPEFDLNFSDCYLVEMELKYSEYYAPMAAFECNIYQMVVLDRDFTPVWVGISLGHYIS